MRIFVINLAKNVERMNLIDARLHGMALNYERIEAVYGKMVPQDERRRTSSRFWWWCIRGIPMRDGEYGCAMSHLEVYRRMIDENINVACVLEDDAKPRACLLSEICRAINVPRSMPNAQSADASPGQGPLAVHNSPTRWSIQVRHFAHGPGKTPIAFLRDSAQDSKEAIAASWVTSCEACENSRSRSSGENATIDAGSKSGLSAASSRAAW